MLDGKLKTEDIKSRKEETKREKNPNLNNVEEYCKIINDIIHINSSSPGAGGPQSAENNKVEQQKSKAKMLLSNKGNQYDVNENKFSIRQLLEKSDSQETYKKSFFVLSDELKEDDEEMSIKLKREILLNKLVVDKSMVNGKVFSDSFNDNALSQIYLSLSSESRKILLENNYDYDCLNSFHNLIGFNYDQFNQNQKISNETILYICNNIIRIEDLFPLSNEETLNVKEKREITRKDIIKTDYDDIEHRVIYEEKKVVDVPKEINKEIISESNIHLKGKDEEDENLNDSGLNMLMEFIKISKDKPVTQKVEKLLNILGKNKDSKVKLDESLKVELLRNFKEEFIKESEKLGKVRNSKEKDNVSRMESPPKSVFSKPSPVKNSKPKQASSNIPTQNNRDNPPILTESEGNISNPFINSLDTPLSKSKVLPTKPVAKKDVNELNQPSKVIFTTSGWGVNQFPIKKTGNIHSNNQSKSNILNTNNTNNSKIMKKEVVKKGNVAVKKYKDTNNQYLKSSATDQPKSKLTRQIEENRKNQNNGWFGENDNNEEDSEEWMVIK